MVDQTEGVTLGGFLFQILLQAMARDGWHLQRTEIGEDVFADAIARGRGGGEFPLAAAEGKKAIANPIGESPDAWEDLTGIGIDGLEEFRHFGQSFGAAQGGAGPQKLAATATVFPPKSNPVPGATGLAFLQTAALKTTATGSGRL